VAGDWFGELGLISGRRRSATVVADAECVLVETPRKQMLKLISSVASVKRRLDRTFVLRTLQSIFPEVEHTFLVDAAKQADLKTFKKGDVVFKEGDPGDALHVIRRGSVKISQKDAQGHDVTRSYFSAGHYLGEIALLSDEDSKRTASVTAVVGCETIVIKKSEFRSLLAANPAVNERFRKVAEMRKISDATHDHDRKQGQVLDFLFGEGITDASNVLVIDSDLCVACDNCETACAATHDGDSRLDRKGGKFFAAVQVPISCRHCENPLCMLDCPPDALTRKPDGEIIIRDSCIGCGNCSTNCPYGVITMTHEKEKGFDLLAWLGLRKRKEGPAKAAKCDMCSPLAAGPACVRACPTGAAVRINPAQLGEMMRRKGGMH
jgi:Fe-S-cluster-containing hydrogenase component 2/CRP-like cAMP-binding protein